MSNTISLEELKNLSLPCLPKNLESIRYRAKTQDWPYIEEVGKARGGRLKKYLIASLPAEIRAAIMKRQSDELAEKMPKMLPQVRPGTAMSAQALAEAAKLLNEKQRSVADARCAVVAAVLGIKYQYGCSAKAAVAQFLGLLAEGKLDAVTLGNLEKANDRSRSAKVGERTLDGWISAYLKAENATERLVALAPKTTKAVKPIESYGWLPMFMQFHNIPSAPKLAHSYRRFVQWAEAENMPVNDVPNLSMVRRVWDKLPMIMQERGRKTGAAYKSLLPYVKRDWGALKPNDVWIGDGHSFKAKVAHPVHGRPFKPEVTVIIDGCTRFVVGFSVSLAESCVAVSDALRIGVKHFGFVNKLKPVTGVYDRRDAYTDELFTDLPPDERAERLKEWWKNPKKDGRHKEKRLQHWFIAQDVAALEDEYGSLPMINFRQDTYTIEYEMFVPVLTKAIQDLTTELGSLKKQIEELRNDKMRD